MTLTEDGKVELDKSGQWGAVTRMRAVVVVVLEVVVVVVVLAVSVVVVVVAVVVGRW